MKRTHWSESTPIPVHCMVFGATEFSIVRAGEANGTEVWYYLYPRDREHGIRELGRVPQILAFYSELVGPYPYDKLAMVESSTRFGGMENASAIFLDEKRIDGNGTLEGLAAHEIAHQWFGDSVSQRDWHELWLSEGFATYFGNLFYERAAGRDAFLERMREDRRDYLAAHRETPRPIYDPSITDLFKLLNRQNYEKGAWVLHMLRGIMGDVAFFAAVRDYYASHRDGNASTDELRVIMERHAGQPLDWFFRQWIREAGHPVFATKWTWREGKTLVDVEQKQAGTVFRVPAVIELRGAKGSTRESVVIDERLEHFELPSESEPAAVVLDPDEWVLKETIPAH
jgi:aminopeptidase N